jgi:hypothetical protein
LCGANDDAYNLVAFAFPPKYLLIFLQRLVFAFHSLDKVKQLDKSLASTFQVLDHSWIEAGQHDLSRICLNGRTHSQQSNLELAFGYRPIRAFIRLDWTMEIVTWIFFASMSSNIVMLAIKCFKANCRMTAVCSCPSHTQEYYDAFPRSSR